MDILDEIKKQEISINSMNDICKNIIKEFSLNIDIPFSFEVYSETLFTLREIQQKVYNSNYVDLFFNLLLKYNYNMKYEIIDAMFELGHLHHPNDNKETISKYLKSPAIDDISYDGKGTYTIYSEKYGNFIFTLASYYYINNDIIIDYILKEHLPHRCHEHTYFMSKILGDAFAVTSLCSDMFPGKYYHSYTYDLDDNNIIDLCYNAVINKDLYYRIFSPEEVSITLNRKVNKELQIVDNKTMQPSGICQILKIALYKQYLKSINYKGSLEDAPTLKKEKI